MDAWKTFSFSFVIRHLLMGANLLAVSFRVTGKTPGILLRSFNWFFGGEDFDDVMGL